MATAEMGSSPGKNDSGLLQRLNSGGSGVLQPSSSPKQSSGKSAAAELPPIHATTSHPISPARSSAASRGRTELVPAWDEGLPVRGGRALNRALDPVMSLMELCDLLEEMDVVPHRVTRQDVSEAFKAACAVDCKPVGVLPGIQVRPDEIRYPQFCDVLVRLAIAADARQAAGGQYGKPQSVPTDAVHALMEAMDIANPNVTLLKRRLDALARMQAERGAKRTALKHLYIAQESAMAASRARPPQLPGNWTVDSTFRAPDDLISQLLSGDAMAALKYLPVW